MIMERKIGEIFEYNGEWYQCVEGVVCLDCSFSQDGYTCDINGKLNCTRNGRNDDKSVVFKKLEKVGEPFSCSYYGDNGLIMMQEYKVQDIQFVYTGKVPIYVTDEKHKRVAIAIKQNQEDMEEKKVKLDKLVTDYTSNKITYNEFEKAVKELYADKEESKPSLKSFSLEAAKQGKPVFTRDGRKARIICFDRRLFYKNVSYPILALVERSDGEDDVCGYNEKGKVLIEDGAEYKDDLMMLPEKKEGWINIYNADTTFYYADGRVFETKDEAVQEAKEEVEKEQREKNEYIDTIRVEWEE